MKITLLTLLVLVSSRGALAVHGDYAEAMRVRRLIEVSGQGLREGAQKIVLPVSRGFDQKGTQLCWAYSSLSVIESNYLARHPDSKLELSRRAMQFITMKDRYTRQVHGTENFISERGIAMDAMALIRDAGLVAFADYKDIADAYGSYSFATQLSAAVTLADKYAKIAKGLEAVYSDPPLKTHLGEQEVTRGQLVKEVVGDQIWQSFAPGNDGEEKFAKHPDPDGRAGAISYYMPREKFAALCCDAVEKIAA